VKRRFLLLAAPAAFALAGCVTLLPKETPAQLYRFGGDLPPAPRQAGAFGGGEPDLDAWSTRRA
jgi:hypothetical protein